ncbi:hypothetical protein [Helicobacter sp. 11S03491-1]|uniref:hypothetical protein n=1 Tax=Helicobacter sp. 11S03491-1 TaxID=1476196 RepID=UPI000BA71283|nr:hypothetical protein [Helicobacter sp. 11S03491-1]PAF41598.1 hypothetical protein BKH45_06775 [Helicobacter sp. 11S03491-1]
MIIETQEVQNGIMVKYEGKIKTYANFLEFKSAMIPIVKQIKQTPNQTLFVFFVHAYPINSYALGYLLKLKENDLIDVKIYTDEMKLFNLFENISLDKKLEISIKQN